MGANGRLNGYLGQPAYPSDRLPPHALESEEYLLGAMMNDPDCIHEVAARLRDDDDFYRAAHREIYRAIRSAYDRTGRCDAALVCEALGRCGALEDVGGTDHVVGLTFRAPHSCNAAHHAEIVRDKSAARDVIAACNRAVAEAYSGQKSGAEIVQSLAAESAGMMSHAVGAGVADAPEAAQKAMQLIADRQEGRGVGLDTGLPALDLVLGGLRPGAMVVVAGRPSMGKTSLAQHVVGHAALDLGVSVLVVSLEVAYDALMAQQLGIMADVSGDVIEGRRGWTPSEMESLDRAYGRIARTRLRIDKASIRSVDQIVAVARREAVRGGLGLLVIDYLQLIDGDSSGRRSRQEVVAGMSRRLKLLAGDLECPVLVLSQLNRQSEARSDKRPSLADLRESGAIEQDADAVVLINRPERHDPNDRPGLAELDVAKNRHGPTGTAKLRFIRERTRFVPWETAEEIAADDF